MWVQISLLFLTSLINHFLSHWGNQIHFQCTNPSRSWKITCFTYWVTLYAQFCSGKYVISIWNMSFFLVFQNSFNIDLHMVIFTEKCTLKVFLHWGYTLNWQNLKKNHVFHGSLSFLYAWSQMYFPLQSYCKKQDKSINVRSLPWKLF